jgi:pyridoxal phosphate enzyme (YggS family)
MPTNSVEKTRPLNIRENLQRVQEEIFLAAQRSGRNPEQVRLVVVSKGQPLSAVQAAMQAGARIFGENYAEQALPKIEALKNEPEIEWHMIGHVQSRKALLVAEHFDLLHSLDSLKLANRINQHCLEGNRRLQVLIECNLAGEESKSGWRVSGESDLKNLLEDLEIVAALPGLEVRGLMTMPPLSPDPQETRTNFRKLVSLQGLLRKKFPQVSWDELSMGTSADFELAVEEGATLVRVGQAILGPRAYPPRSG